jgi:hypothetical protein
MRAGARGNPPQRTDFRVRVTELPRDVDWRNVKDFLRSGGEVTFCDVQSDGTAYVPLCAVVHGQVALVLTRAHCTDNQCC